MARLPIPGSDSGNWGDILNEYLSQSLDSDGSLLANSVGNSQLQNESITGSKLAAGAVTKSDVGLGNVDNTSDVDKPISTAVSAALNNKMSGASNATSNAIVRFDGTTGKSVNNSNVYVSDNGHVGINHINPATPLHIYEYNTVNGSTGGLTIEQGSTGNSLLHFLITSVQRWQVGIDRANNNNFTIGRGSGWAHGQDLVLNTSGNVGLNTLNPTHKLTFGSSSTGIALYSTSDQTTDYERLGIYWDGTQHNIITQGGGSAAPRPLRLMGAWSSLTLAAAGRAIEARRDNTTLDLLRVTSTGLTRATSIAQTALTLDPVINQSGAGGYTMLLVNPTEASLGSGAKLLADFQTGGNSKVSIDNGGKLSWQSDTNLYRHLAGQLKTDGALIVESGLFVSQSSGVSRIGITSSGVLEFGSGTAARDAFISRTAAGRININSELTVNNKQSLTPGGWHFMGNSSPPSGPPAGGGTLFVQNGALMYIGSAGTITMLAPA